MNPSLVLRKIALTVGLVALVAPASMAQFPAVAQGARGQTQTLLYAPQQQVKRKNQVIRRQRRKLRNKNRKIRRKNRVIRRKNRVIRRRTRALNQTRQQNSNLKGRLAELRRQDSKNYKRLLSLIDRYLDKPDAKGWKTVIDNDIDVTVNVHSRDDDEDECSDHEGCGEPEPGVECPEDAECEEPGTDCEEGEDCEEPGTDCEEGEDCEEPGADCEEGEDCEEPGTDCEEGEDCEDGHDGEDGEATRERVYSVLNPYVTRGEAVPAGQVASLLRQLGYDVEFDESISTAAFVAGEGLSTDEDQVSWVGAGQSD